MKIVLREFAKALEHSHIHVSVGEREKSVGYFVVKTAEWERGLRDGFDVQIGKPLATAVERVRAARG